MRHLKNHKKYDRGFTLVELIIVIAIIAVMSVVGLSTVSMINSAKAKEAGVTFDAEVADMVTKAKSQVYVDNSGSSEVWKPEYRHCLMVYKHADGKYYLRHGYYDSDMNNTSYATEEDRYLFNIVDNNNDQKGVSLSNRIDITYIDTANNQYKINNSGASDSVNHVYIVFNPDGTIRNGAGKYTVYKSNGNEVTQLTVRKNGSHKLD